MKVPAKILLSACFLTATTLHADITVSITEFPEANIVMVSTTGSLTTTALSPASTPSPAGLIRPDTGYLISKEVSAGSVDVATVGSTGTVDFGLDLLSPADYFFGDSFGFTDVTYILPTGYTSGDPISSTLIFLGQSILSLGIDEANAPFTTTLSTGDQLTIQIVDKVDQSALDAVAASAASTELVLRRKIKKLNRKLKAAKRNSRR